MKPRLRLKGVDFKINRTRTAILTLSLPETKIAEFANSGDLDEPPHLDLHCLPSSLRILNMIQLGLNSF